VLGRDHRSIELIEISKLKPALRNARTHSKQQIKQIAGSIQRFGFTIPILVDDDNRIMAGHGRSEAAKSLEIAEVPCLHLSGMSDADKRAYVIADNKLALNAGWDQGALAAELQELMDVGFEVELTGFELPEIDALLSNTAEASLDGLGAADEYPPPGTCPVTQPGDRWALGRHVLVCGDAKDPATLDVLQEGRLADMIFTDPPYNVPIEGHVSGLGRTQHREFLEASGEMSPDQFIEFLTQTLAVAAKGCRDGAIAYVCMDWRHLGEVIAAGKSAFTELKNICVWAKTNGGMGTFYRSQHEMVLVFKIGSAAHTNTFGLGDKGRYRTNVWSYPGVNTFKSERMEELASHPTVKPVALVADAIRDVSHRGQVVLDIFGGSGTTLIAAEKTGRCARLLEIDPIYCDVIIRRWQKLTGRNACLSNTGETFEAIEILCAAPAALQPIGHAA
jgi:DNA modification methylase